MPKLTNKEQGEINELLNLHDSEYLTAIYQAKGWQIRYTGILKLGRAVQEKPDIRLKQYEIQGCESKLWVKSTLIDDKMYYCVDSESRIIRGLASLLLLQVNAKPLAEIQTFRAKKFLNAFNLDKHISPSRNNGLSLLLESIQKKT